MAQTKPRVRFAPSPTGQLHLGGARTALFNWLFAKHNQGTFLLRIEDTDLQRSKSEYTEQICESLQWLGLNWDEDIIYQSQRSKLYKDAIDNLLENGNAYRCFATKDELNQYREKDGSLFYPGLWRDCSEKDIQNKLDSDTPFTIRLKTPNQGSVSFQDEIYGQIKVQASEIDDFIIARSDGTPVYNLVVVIDDHDMKISHLIRGEDHTSNTLKQLLIYKALHYDIPIFVHLPMILGEDKKRLSKRHSATGVQAYRKSGYTSDTMINHLALLGWNPGTEQDIFTLQDLIAQFKINRVQKKPAVFDMQRLNWISSQHIMSMDLKKIHTHILSLHNNWGKEKDAHFLLQIIALLKPRCKTILDFVDLSDYFFFGPKMYDAKMAKKKWKTEETSQYMNSFTKILEDGSEWSDSEIEKKLKQFAEKNELKMGGVIAPVRLAICGIPNGPSLFSIMSLLGKKTCIRRLKSAINTLPLK